MIFKIKSMLAICLLAFAAMQSAQAVGVYSSFATTNSSFSISETFAVTAGTTYVATLTDSGLGPSPVFDNFDVLSMVVYDDMLIQLPESPLSLVPTTGSGFVSVFFEFTVLADAIYSVALFGATDAVSNYTASIVAVPPVVGAVVPVPGAVWLLGSGMIALVGFGRRKAA